MKKAFLFSLLHLLTVSSVFAQMEVFPKGMKWEECLAEPGSPIDLNNTTKYEVGDQIEKNGVTYKSILINSENSGLLVRESNNVVWLLTSDYPEEIKLYDFNWDSTQPLTTEYLKEIDEEGTGVEKLSLEWLPDYEETFVGDNTYKYYKDNNGAEICNIGRVTDLNRNGSLLGYKVPYISLPGLIYSKVLWISRNDKEIFRSESSDEWIIEIPNGISQNTYTITKTSPLYDLSGRRLNGEPQHGVYIKDGKKVVIK